MFNENQKKEYLNSIADNGDKYVSGIRSLFKNLSAIEKNEDKDFCQFDKEMAIDAIAQISGRKKTTKSWYLSALKDYLDWCVFNQITDQNQLNGVRYSDIDTSRSIRFETIPNIEYLKRVLEIGFPEINDKDVSMNTIYKLYAFLLYSGLTDQEVVDITKEEMKVHNNILNYNGKDIYIHPFVKSYIDRVLPASEIIWIKFGREMNIDLMPSDKLIGCVRALDNRIGNFKNILTKFNKTYQNETGKYIRLSSTRIYESGVFYRLLQDELEKGEVNEDIIKNAFDVDVDSFVQPISYHMRIYDLKKDYESWKKAWNYDQIG